MISIGSVLIDPALVRSEQLVELHDFVQAYTDKEQGSMQALLHLLDLLEVNPQRPRHGQRLGQWIYNNVIADHRPHKTVNMACVFYCTDKAELNELLKALHALLSKELKERHLS